MNRFAVGFVPLAAVSFVLAISTHLGAQCLVDLSTGFDQSGGAVLTAGDPDDDYTVDGGGGAAAALTGGSAQGFPTPPWVENDETSLWISPGANSNADPGAYTFEVRFQMPDGVSAGLVTLVGRLTADDSLADIVVNGVSTGITASGFNVWTTIPVGAGAGLFQSGENTVQLVVSNGGEAANPCGLRVNACAAIPEAEIRPYGISTGFDRSAGMVLPNAADDTSYTLTGPDGSGIGPGPAVVIQDDAFPIPPWIGSSVQSKWIGPASDSNGPPGDYVYSIDVELPAEVDAAFATLAGGFAADDSVLDVLVNGVSTGVTGSGFGALIPIPDATGRGLFVTGTNTIELVVQNGGDAAGPTGLRVDAWVATCPAADPPAVLPSDLVLDTGLDDATGALIENALPDDNYEVVLPPGSEACRAQAVVIQDDAFPIPPWLATSEISKWIGAAADSNAGAGTFAYRITVDVPEELDAARLKLLGAWSSDNAGLDVLVNGVSTGAAHDGNFAVLHAFPADAGLGLFQAGPNVVEFLVENIDPGPTGLRVEGVVGQGVEPGDLSTGVGPRDIGPVPPGFTDGRYLVEDFEDENSPPVLAAEAGWLANTEGSRWIGPLDAGSQVAYTITFDLGPEVNPQRVSLEGGWTSAPAGGTVILNGVDLELSSVDPVDLTAFPEGAGRGGFVPGANTLTFLVDAPEEGDPAGLRVDAGWMQSIAPDPFDISTGLDESTALVIPAGDPDPQYTVVLPDTTEVTATVVTGAPIPPWIPTTISSAWIGTDAAASNAEPGTYRFLTGVSLLAEEAERAFISGAFAADDSITDIVINGTSTGLVSELGFGGLTMFPAEFGLGLFQDGDNTIEFVVSNGGEAANSFGLRVDATVALLPPAGGSQRPSDCNQDGNLDISDGICLLGHLFLGSPSTLPCGDGATTDPGNTQLVDTNGDGNVDLSDAVAIFGFLFLGSSPPALGLECVPIAGCPEVCGG